MGKDSAEDLTDDIEQLHEIGLWDVVHSKPEKATARHARRSRRDTIANIAMIQDMSDTDTCGTDDTDDDGPATYSDVSANPDQAVAPPRAPPEPLQATAAHPRLRRRRGAVSANCKPLSRWVCGRIKIDALWIFACGTPRATDDGNKDDAAHH